MMPGGRVDPRQLNRMMKQLGIQVEEIDGVTEVVIRAAAGTYRFDKPSVTLMVAQGQKTWQIQGEPALEPAAGAPPAPAPTPPQATGPLFTDEDVKLVMQQARVDAAKARTALEKANGEVAQAIVDLTGA